MQFKENQTVTEDKELLLQKIKPSAIDISSDLVGSKLRESNKETIAKNIIVNARNSGDQWSSFSFSEYKATCSHDVSDSERNVLDSLVADGYLSFQEDRYSVKPEFIEALLEFKDTEERRNEQQAIREKIATEEAEQQKRKKEFLLELNDNMDYEALQQLAKKHGFKADKLFRGADFKTSHVAGKYEIWFETASSNGKAGFGDTLEDAMKEAISYLRSTLDSR